MGDKFGSTDPIPKAAMGATGDAPVAEAGDA